MRYLFRLNERKKPYLHTSPTYLFPFSHLIFTFSFLCEKAVSWTPLPDHVGYRWVMERSFIAGSYIYLLYVVDRYVNVSISSLTGRNDDSMPEAHPFY